MIFFDTETTGLIKEGIMDPLQQPKIIELAVVITDPQCVPIWEWETLLNPCVPIPEEITRINGIRDADVMGMPTFPDILTHLIDAFRLDDTLVAHNVRFDLMMLVYELMRHGWEYRFPYPRHQIDTVDDARRACGSGKLINWFKHVRGEQEIKQSHRAMGDVRMLIECYKSINRGV